jgi:hypothetical protein
MHTGAFRSFPALHPTISKASGSAVPCQDTQPDMMRFDSILIAVWLRALRSVYGCRLPKSGAAMQVNKAHHTQADSRIVTLAASSRSACYPLLRYYQAVMGPTSCTRHQ